MKEVLADVADYLTEIGLMWDFVHYLTGLLTRTYKVQGVFLRENLSENGPFRCYFDLYTNEHRPTTEEFQALAERFQCFSFPLTCCVRDGYRMAGEGQYARQYCSLQVTIDYGFNGLN